MAVAVWVLVALTVIAALVIGFFLWWSEAIVMRPYRNRPTVRRSRRGDQS